MSEELKSVTIYATFVEAIDGVCKNDAEKGKMYSAVVRYALFGEEPKLSSVLLAVFSLMKPAIDKSKMRKINGAKRKQNGSKTDVCSINNEEAKENQNESDIYLNDNTSTSSSSSNSNSLSVSFSYPETVEDVLQIADKAGCVISRDEAQRYFICRMSADWVDAAGRKIAASRIGYDLKRWVLNAQKNQKNQPESKQREVKYEPSF